MDCEMVGLGPHNESGLARCSLVDAQGAVVYDKFIRPEGEITNYRTSVSGITAQHLQEATPFAVARLEVSPGPGPAGLGVGGLQTPSSSHRHTSLAPPPSAAPGPVPPPLRGEGQGGEKPGGAPLCSGLLPVCGDELGSHPMFPTLIGGWTPRSFLRPRRPPPVSPAWRPSRAGAGWQGPPGPETRPKWGAHSQIRLGSRVSCPSAGSLSICGPRPTR